MKTGDRALTTDGGREVASQVITVPAPSTEASHQRFLETMRGESVPTSIRNICMTLKEREIELGQLEKYVGTDLSRYSPMLRERVLEWFRRGCRP